MNIDEMCLSPVVLRVAFRYRLRDSRGIASREGGGVYERKEITSGSRVCGWFFAFHGLSIAGYNFATLISRSDHSWSTLRSFQETRAPYALIKALHTICISILTDQLLRTSVLQPPMLKCHARHYKPKLSGPSGAYSGSSVEQLDDDPALDLAGL